MTTALCPVCRKAIMKSESESPDAIMTCGGCGAQKTFREYLNWITGGQTAPGPAYTHFFYADERLDKENDKDEM